MIRAGTFNVIAKGMPGPLTVDGRPQEWNPLCRRRPAWPGWGSRPGHQIRIGSRKIDFSVALDEEEHDGPWEWEIPPAPFDPGLRPLFRLPPDEH